MSEFAVEGGRVAVEELYGRSAPEELYSRIRIIAPDGGFAGPPPPLTHPDGLGFHRHPGLDFQVLVQMGAAGPRLGLRWVDGERCLYDPAEPTDLTISAAPALAIHYLCGDLPTYALLDDARIAGEVSAVSCLHGLTHAPEVLAHWAARAEIVQWWIAVLRPPEDPIRRS